MSDFDDFPKQPLQWSYDWDNGVARATFPGEVQSTGGSQPGLAVPVENFGKITAGQDCTAVVQAALNGATAIVFSQGKTYTFGSKPKMNAGNVIWGYGATIAAKAGYTDHYFIDPAQGGKIMGLAFDGSNLPSPTAAWLGVGTPLGSAICGDGTGTACDDFLAEDCQFSNFPSGPFFLRQCHRWKFVRPKFANVQIYTAFVVNAVIETFNSNDPTIEDADCNGYTSKGINLGNCLRGAVTRPHFYGAGQNAGFATYYEDGSTDCTWTTLRHEGVGFFFKAHNSIRSTVRDVNADGTIYAQVAKDFKVFGGTLTLPTAANQATIFEGIAPAAGVAGGPCDTVLVDGLTARRVTPGTTTNHVLAQLSPDAGYPVSGVKIINCTYENMEIGLNATGVSTTAFVDDFLFENNTGINTVQYDVLSFAKSPTVRKNKFINVANAFASLLIYGPIGAVGQKCDLSENTITGRTGNEVIAVGLDATNTFGTIFQLVRVNNNYTDGANLSVHFDISNTVANNRVGALEVRGNVGVKGQGANAMTLVFHTVNPTAVNVQDNFQLQTSGAASTITVTNGAQITFGNMQDQGIINSVVNRPNNVHPLRGTTPPVAGLFLRGTIFYNEAAAQGGFGSWVNVANGGASFLNSGAIQTPGIYSITNPVVNRIFDTTTVTLPQLAQVVGTIIADEKIQKILT